MKQALSDRLTLFAGNVSAAQKGFKWHIESARMAALVYAIEDRVLDDAAIEKIKEARKMINADTGAFSIFRGNLNLGIATLLSLSDRPEALLADILTAYDRLREEKFSASDQLAMASYLIASNTEAYNFRKTAQHARRFADGLDRRWFSFAKNDPVFASLLGLSDIDPRLGTERINEVYQQLKPEFRWAGSSSVESLAQVLTLGEKPDEALECLLKLNSSLRENKIKLDGVFTLPSLGMLTLLPVDDTQLTDDLVAAQDYLRKQKGLGVWSVSSDEVMLVSAGIVSSVYSEDLRDEISASVASSIAAMIAAQQAAIMAMIVASSVAASSAAAAGGS
jgi:hypothetical protein